jgi:hypothetical protein
MRTPVALPPSFDGRERAMFKGRLSKQARSFQDRLFKFVADAAEKVRALPPGPEREGLLKKIAEARATINMERWANSPGLRPPK